MNLNIFKRIADLEVEVERLSRLIDGQSVWTLELSDKLSQLRQTKQTDLDQAAKRRAYARAYYQANKAKRKKKAERTKEAKEWTEQLRKDASPPWASK